MIPFIPMVISLMRIYHPRNRFIYFLKYADFLVQLNGFVHVEDEVHPLIYLKGAQTQHQTVYPHRRSCNLSQKSNSPIEVMNMHHFIDNRAEPVFVDSTSPSFFAHFAKMNADDKLTFGNNDNKTVNLHEPAKSSGASSLVQEPTDCEDDGEETDAKKMKRVLANRRSARESYQRRKKMFSELESAVATLTKENAELAEENKKLRRQVINLHQQLGLSNTSMPSDMGAAAGMAPNNLPLQHLATPQSFQSLPTGLSQQLHPTGLTPQQQQLLQQQGELDQLLELILRGRQS
jgi:hypothetical protein